MISSLVDRQTEDLKLKVSGLIPGPSMFVFIFLLETKTFGLVSTIQDVFPAAAAT